MPTELKLAFTCFILFAFCLAIHVGKRAPGQQSDDEKKILAFTRYVAVVSFILMPVFILITLWRYA